MAPLSRITAAVTLTTARRGGEGPERQKKDRARLSRSYSSPIYATFEEADIAEDYRRLLRRGSVMRRLAPTQHTAWRKAIRATARADEHRIRTWSRPGRPAEVWAVLRDWSLTAEEREKLRRRLDWIRED